MIENVILLVLATGSIVLGSIFSIEKSDVETGEIVELSQGQVLAMPFSASICLLLLFYYFAVMQYVMIIVLVFASILSLYDLLSRLIKFRCLGNGIFHHTLLAVITGAIAFEWIRSGNFLAHDLLGCSICICFLSVVRFPSMKLAALCLSMLVVYDGFWVFFSQYFFQKNVMLQVATQAAINPIHLIGKTMVWSIITNNIRQSLELPIKLMIPSQNGRMSILGLGDIVLPGLVIAMALRCDVHLSHKFKSKQDNSLQSQVAKAAPDCSFVDLEKDSSNSNNKQAVKYSTNGRLVEQATISGAPSSSSSSSSTSYTPTLLFETGIAGYIVGLMLAFVASVWSRHPQPALIYLAPCVVLPVMLRAQHCKVAPELWGGPKPFQA